jgi:hypothetical protein
VRLAVAIAVVAVTWAGAVYVHQRHTTLVVDPPGCSPYFDKNCSVAVRQHPSWEDPVAVLLALGGVAVAVGVARR